MPDLQERWLMLFNAALFNSDLFSPLPGFQPPVAGTFNTGPFNSFPFTAIPAPPAQLPTYDYVTLTQAETDLAARLYDPGMHFWTAAELAVYLIEALRTWNALAMFWRADFTFPLKTGVRWYDITQVSTAPNTLRPLSVPDSAIVQAIEYHLLEPPNITYPLTWAGSRQFSFADILGAITRRQNQVLGATGCTITRQVVNAPTNLGLKKIGLDDRTLTIRRVAWLPAQTSTVFNSFKFNTVKFTPVVKPPLYGNTVLRQGDIWAKRAFNPAYLPASNNTAPGVWIQNTDPQPGFNVDRVPPAAGNYEVLTVNAGPTSNSNAASTMAVPNDWTWLVKWGALSDLLGREGQAKDPLRAAYCAKRFEEGLKILAGTAAVLGLTINDAYSLFPDAVRNGDDFRPTWEADPPAPPARCYAAGLNLLAFNTPSNNNYTARAFVVQNAPVPSGNNSYIQIARSDYDELLNYAQHLAAFKMAGDEFVATIPLYQSFMAQAARYNRVVAEMGQFELDQEEISQLESERRPVAARE